MFGQNIIPGKYCFSLLGEFNKKVDAECIVFLPNNRFEYDYSFFNFRFGKGKYLIQEDTLKLFFEKYNDNRFYITDSTLSETDSVKINLTLLNEKLDPLPYAVVLLLKSGNDKEPDTISGGNTDWNGKTNLIIKKDTNNLFLLMKSIGTKPMSVVISGQRNINLIGYFYNNYPSIDNEIWYYSIVSMKTKKIKLKKISNNNVSIIQTFIKKKVLPTCQQP